MSPRHSPAQCSIAASMAAPESVSPRRAVTGQYTVWEIVSKTAAAILGGYAVTYWLGAAVGRGFVLARVLDHSEAVYLVGMLQMFIYVGVVVWVCAGASPRRTWAGLALVTAASMAAALIGKT